MPNVLQKTLTLLTGIDEPQLLKMPKKRPLKKLTERELIQLESQVGRTLFGPIPEGHTREFFNLDSSTWVWFEEFTDPATGKLRSITTRYEIHDNGILKAQEGARYSYLEGEELKNFAIAVQMYYERVTRGVYHRDPKTGRKLI